MRYLKALFGKYDHEWTTPNYHPVAVQGLTKFKVANDLHIGSEYQDNPNALAELVVLANDGRTVLNGDIFDLACCSKATVTPLRDLVSFYQRRFGKFYRLGNHERMSRDHDDLIITTDAGKRVLFEHGDLISDFKKWYAYRLKEQGSSKLGLKITKLLDNLDHIKKMRPLPKGFIENAARMCVNVNADAIVVGHFHVERERRYYHQGKEIVILPAHKINEVWL